MPGFEQAGGNAGPGYDFYANPNGNLALAESYMKKAGYPSGKYTGPPLLTIADNAVAGVEHGAGGRSSSSRSSASS